MKKVLFFAAVLAVASMTFVACGKKENKEAEGEQKECCEKHEGCQEAKEAEKAACCEKQAAEDAQLTIPEAVEQLGDAIEAEIAK